MGWFWAEATTPKSWATPAPSKYQQDGAPLPGPPHAACPMRHKTVEALTPAGHKPSPPSLHQAAAPPSGCPIPHDQRKEPSGLLSKLNPLNYMFNEISQAPAPNQKVALPTGREISTIPKGAEGEEGKWAYPSPQQMYNALLRKGYTDTDVTAVESMVSVHNFLNEGAWGEIVDWENRFSGGLMRGVKICSWGEENGAEAANLYPDPTDEDPKLVRFQGRPKDMTPKAAALQALGWVLPKFASEPPFDRHDWYVSRTVNGETEHVRYVIDYYSGPPEHGFPVFYLDVRPAFTPKGALERFTRWGGDTWWRAMGGSVRYGNLSDKSDDGVD